MDTKIQPIIPSEAEEIREEAAEIIENIEESFKIPGPPPLAALLDEGIQQEIDKEEKERIKGKITRFPLSPSQFGACGRQLAIALAEFEGLGIYPNEMMDPRSKRRFTRGYDIEYSLLKQTQKYIPIFQSFGQQYLEMAETPDKKYVIGGSIDKVFVTDESMIVDIKSKATYYSSTSSDAFQEEFDSLAETPGVEVFGDNAIFIKDIWEFYKSYPTDNFISRYFVQLNAYGCSPWAVNFMSNTFPGQKGIKAVALLFENKNNHQMGEIRWVPDKRLYDMAIDKIQDIYKHVVMEKKPPEQYPADFTLGSLMCRFCSRKTVCYADARMPYNGPKKEWPKDVAKLEQADKLLELYEKYKKALTEGAVADILEKDILTILNNQKVNRVRFLDDKVYDLQYRKTPKPHFKLKPSK